METHARLRRLARRIAKAHVLKADEAFALAGLHAANNRYLRLAVEQLEVGLHRCEQRRKKKSTVEAAQVVPGRKTN